MSLKVNHAFSLLPQALLVLFLAVNSIAAIKCYKTHVASTPHVQDCGTSAKGCRIIVNPYAQQNNSAVTTCVSEKRESGNYIYDCAVECPTDKSKWYWNEVECCSTDECNSGANLQKEKRCYESKKGVKNGDNIVVCEKPKFCALNEKTEETKCIGESECKGKGWFCCTDEEVCASRWGIYKPKKTAGAEESTDAAQLLPTTGLALACLSAAWLSLRTA